jgi:hypothetical protein
MRLKIVLSFAILLASLAALGAEPQLPDDPSGFLGMTSSDFFARVGPPTETKPLDASAAQAGVSARYAFGLTASFSGDRLWCLHFGPGYPGSVYGLFVGDSMDKALSLLGTPYAQAGSDFVYRLAYRGYPVRLRIVGSASGIADICLYRGDF